MPTASSAASRHRTLAPGALQSSLLSSALCYTLLAGLQKCWPAHHPPQASSWLRTRSRWMSSIHVRLPVPRASHGDRPPPPEAARPAPSAHQSPLSCFFRRDLPVGAHRPVRIEGHHDAYLEEHFTNEPLIVFARPQGPEIDSNECDRFCQCICPSGLACRMHACVHFCVHCAHARLSCTPPTCKITPSFREHVRR